jgi:fluoride exporter
MVPFVIFLGAGLGGLSRYAIGGWVQSALGAGYPWGTLVINVSGSLALMFLYAMLDSSMARPEWRAFLGIGFLGGYTTFSTFTYETIRLWQDGEWARGIAYVGGSVVLSLAAGLLGLQLATALIRRG